MLEWMFENSVPSILVGCLAMAILAGGWLQTGSRWLLRGLIAAALLTVAAVLVERFVETDREQITATLHQIADLVEKNEIAEAVAFAHSSMPKVRGEALAELSKYKFSQVDIKRNLQIEVYPRETPARAEAEFNVLVVVSLRDGLVTDRRVPRFVEVTFYREEQGDWRVGGYRHYDPFEGYRRDQGSDTGDDRGRGYEGLFTE